MDQPEPGGGFVLHEDGRKSFSSGGFERGLVALVYLHQLDQGTDGAVHRRQAASSGSRPGLIQRFCEGFCPCCPPLALCVGATPCLLGAGHDLLRQRQAPYRLFGPQDQFPGADFRPRG